ncbi:MAG: metallophosphoesterase family protein [Actinomycetota bacterium]|nr:metallophosphoesterase family protein [Actinomycetota bacterium]
MDGVLVLADTHLPAHRADALPVEIWDVARRATGILHAGDVVCPELLDALGRLAPLHAVLGNNDLGQLDLPERLEVQLSGVRIAMVHDSGARLGRGARMRRWFPDAAVVIFGHSHDPMNERGAGGQLLFNPGSPTQRRRQPACSYGWLRLEDGRVLEHEVRLLR